MTAALKKHGLPFEHWVALLSTGGAINAIAKGALDKVPIVSPMFSSRVVNVVLAYLCLAAQVSERLAPVHGVGLSGEWRVPRLVLTLAHRSYNVFTGRCLSRPISMGCPLSLRVSHAYIGEGK